MSDLSDAVRRVNDFVECFDMHPPASAGKWEDAIATVRGTPLLASDLATMIRAIDRAGMIEQGP